MRYIEIIALVNLFIHVCFIVISNYLFKSKNKKISILISCILDVIYVSLYLLVPYELEKFKYIVIFIISITPFITNGFTKALLQALIYMMLNFCLGGTAEVLYNIINNFYSVLIAIFLIIILFSIYALYKRIHFNHKSLLYEIYIEDKNKKLKLKGFCDTGNFLKTDENIPVVFIKNGIEIGEYKKDIYINTVSTKSKISLYEVKRFKIKLNKRFVKKDVYIAFADISFNAMFGLDILGG